MARPHDRYDQWFGENVSRLRTQRGLSQSRLAKDLAALGLPFHQTTIARVESGTRAVRLGEAALIALYFSVPLTHLLIERRGSDEEVPGEQDLQMQINEAMSELADVDREIESAAAHHAVVVDRQRRLLDRVEVLGRELEELRAVGRM